MKPENTALKPALKCPGVAQQAPISSAQLGRMARHGFGAGKIRGWAEDSHSQRKRKNILERTIN